MIGIIYKYTSPSGKSYIGQTINERVRKLKHVQDSYTSDYVFYRAIRKYGFKNFKYEVLYKTPNISDIKHIKELLNIIEQLFISYYNSFSDGYNCTKGGGGVAGHKFSKNSKIKMSLSKYGKNNHFYGKSHSAKAKKKISESKKGNKHHLYGKRLPDKCMNAMIKAISKPMLQFDLNNNFVKEWSSGLEANRNLNIDSSSITKCAKGKLKSAGGYLWEYKF